MSPRSAASCCVRLTCRYFLLAFAAIALAASSAQAQTYPSRTVRQIISFAAGGPGDTVGRMVAPKLSELWGHQVVIDNRAGANSIVGTEAAARAPADGHTLIMNCFLFA